jgi:uncharacterized membrane protein YdjX (TVP38/TMEM64 family)
VSSGPDSPRLALKPLLKGLAMLALMGLAVAALRWAGEQGVLSDRQWFDAHLRNHGLSGVLLYVGVTGLLTALGMPRQFFCFIGGYLYGFWAGTLLGTLGSTLGCMLAVGFARFFARDFVAHRFGRRVAKVDAFLRRDPLRMALIIRFFPVGSNLATNLLAGVSSIPVRPFVLGSSLGYLPQTVVFALFGSGVNVSSTAQIVLSVALFLAATALGVGMYRRFRAEAAGVVEDGD